MSSIFLSIVIILFAGLAGMAQTCRMDSGGPQKVPCANEVLTYELGKVQKIAGVVTDPNGDRLPGVKLALFRVEDDEKTFVGSSEGDDKGRFCFPGLPKGNTFCISARGMNRLVASNA